VAIRIGDLLVKRGVATREAVDRAALEAQGRGIPLLSFLLLSGMDEGELAGALADGLRLAGIDVIDVGAVPTPVVYYAAYRYETGCGVAVTGSHNPPDYNGFKIVVGGETLSEGAIKDLYQRIASGALQADGGGSLRMVDVVPDYVERITSDVQTERMLKIVVDCGNGIPGAVAPQVLEGIGCQVLPLY
jgi:phosphomannomutase/phosphoglucomutase